MRPVELIVRPGGKPVALKALCGPLVAVIWYGVKAMPSPPVAVAGLLITGGPSVITICSVNSALLPKAFEPRRRTFVVATVVGVPLITPVADVRMRFGGS